MIPSELGGMWSFFRRMAVEHYPVYRYWFGPTPVVCISHPDDIRVSTIFIVPINFDLF